MPFRGVPLVIVLDMDGYHRMNREAHADWVDFNDWLVRCGIVPLCCCEMKFVGESMEVILTVHDHDAKGMPIGDWHDIPFVLPEPPPPCIWQYVTR